MNQTFQVNVNQTIDFEIVEKDISSLDFTKISEKKYHALHNTEPFQIEILQSDFNTKRYVIKVNNNKYEVHINDDLDQLINEMGFSLGSTKSVNTINAPMPGLILDINVKVGEKVKENDALLVLEAMKMENVITSPRDGVIKSVAAIKGNTVDKGTLLIEFGP